MREQLAVGEVQHRVDVLHIVLGEDVVFFCECGFHRLRSRGHGRAGIRADDLHERRVQHVIHGEEDRVQRLLAVLLLDQVVDVRNADLRREARIDGAAAGARAIQFGTGVIGVDDVLRLHAEALEIAVEQRRVGVDVQHARNADAELLAILHQRAAFFVALASSRPSLWSAADRQRSWHSPGRKTSLDAVVDKVRDAAARIVSSPALMSFMSLTSSTVPFSQVAMIRRCSPCMSGTLVTFWIGTKLRSFFGCSANVDEGAQAVVLAEMAARIFVARGAVFDLANGIEADEGGLQAVAPQAQRFLRRTDRAGFAAVLVHDDFRLLAGGAEAVADEIHFRFHDGKIVLRSALQDEARAERREIRNAGDVEENILRQHGSKSGENFFRPPALALEVHDVRLHEHRAAIAEYRHGLRGEGQIGVLLRLSGRSLPRWIAGNIHCPPSTAC